MPSATTRMKLKANAIVILSPLYVLIVYPPKKKEKKRKRKIKPFFSVASVVKCHDDVAC